MRYRAFMEGAAPLDLHFNLFNGSSLFCKHFSSSCTSDINNKHSLINQRPSLGV